MPPNRPAATGIEFRGWVDGDEKRDLLRRPSSTRCRRIMRTSACRWPKRLPAVCRRLSAPHVLISDDLAAANAAWVTANDRASLATTLLGSDDRCGSHVSRSRLRPAVRARARVAARGVTAPRRLRVAPDRGESAASARSARRPVGDQRALTCAESPEAFSSIRDSPRTCGANHRPAAARRDSASRSRRRRRLGRGRRLSRRPPIQSRCSSTAAWRSSIPRAPGRSR